ncbi:MAG: TatD family hydrolase [Patescibacteria group bacterium]
MIPKLFDIHCHLNLPDFANDWPAVLERTLAEGCWLINVGADLASSKLAVLQAETKEEGIWATVGFHPTAALDLTEANWNEVKKLAVNPKVVAIGECGLDYARMISNELRIKAKQKAIFEKHIKLALELDKPLMIHCRSTKDSMDAYEDAIAILNDYKKTAGDKLRGNFHFFAGDGGVGKQVLDMGFTLSFTGVITFANQYDEVIKNTPLDMILAETDAPFVAPVPYRGKRCEPLYVVEVVSRLAELKNLPAQKMAEISVQNAKRSFDI